VADGALVVPGGGRPESQPTGWYVEPTVFAGVDNRMRIAQEEIFGPVVCVIPYEDPDDAVRIANESDYGLSGSVWTADVDRGLEVARRIRTGSYAVNGFGLDFAGPFAFVGVSQVREKAAFSDIPLLGRRLVSKKRLAGCHAVGGGPAAYPRVGPHRMRRRDLVNVHHVSTLVDSEVACFLCCLGQVSQRRRGHVTQFEFADCCGSQLPKPKSQTVCTFLRVV
jgi:hypothetical protein